MAADQMICFPRLFPFYSQFVSEQVPSPVNPSPSISAVDILSNLSAPAAEKDEKVVKSPAKRCLNPLVPYYRPPPVYLSLVEHLPRQELHKLIMGNIYEMRPECIWGDYGDMEECDEWYLFTLRSKEYENAAVIDRVIGVGYWLLKACRPIVTGQNYNVIEIGVCRAFKFYDGTYPNGTETAWAMHEYRLKDPCDPRFKVNDWVLAKIHKSQT